MDSQDAAMVALGQQWSRMAQQSDRAAMADLLTEDFIMWYNFNKSERGKAEFIRTLQEARTVFPEQRHTEERVTATRDGFILQATMHGRMNGQDIAAAFCLICRVRDGKIYRADEYFDTGQLPLVASSSSSEMVASGN